MNAQEMKGMRAAVALAAVLLGFGASAARADKPASLDPPPLRPARLEMPPLTLPALRLGLPLPAAPAPMFRQAESEGAPADVNQATNPPGSSPAAIGQAGSPILAQLQPSILSWTLTPLLMPTGQGTQAGASATAQPQPQAMPARYVPVTDQFGNLLMPRLVLGQLELPSADLGPLRLPEVSLGTPVPASAPTAQPQPNAPPPAARPSPTSAQPAPAVPPAVYMPPMIPMYR